MTELGWNQTDVANDVGTTDGNVSRWLSGRRKPSLKMAFRLQVSQLSIPAHAWIANATEVENDIGETTDQCNVG